MPSNTPNLNLYKVNGETDGNDTFNVDVVLNGNWDKIDAAVKAVEDGLANVDVPDASLTKKGIVQLSNITDGTREDLASTEKAVGIVQGNLATHLADLSSQAAGKGASLVGAAPIAGLSGANVQSMLQSLFTFANDGKTAVADAVTAKGVPASSTDTFGTLASKIGQIKTNVPHGQQDYTAAGTYSFTVPADVKQVFAIVVGGGGAGGAGKDSTSGAWYYSASGGGGGGGGINASALQVTPGQVINVVVGGGGVAGGSSGGDSSFGSLVAKGGKNGTDADADGIKPGTGGSGGVGGGLGSNGKSGGSGSKASYSVGNAALNYALGGSSFGNFGAGGSGGYPGNFGSNGSNGRVLITW